MTTNQSPDSTKFETAELEELLPCPFCGEPSDLTVHVYGNGEDDAYVQCRECTTCGPDGGDRAGAIAKWNYRALLAADGEAGGEVAQDGYLCQAWGETDTPCAEVVWDLAGVRAFMAREWFGSADDPDIELVMQEITGHDFKDEGDWHAEFEIGGVSVKPVYSYTRPQQAAQVAQPLTEVGRIVESIPGGEGKDNGPWFENTFYSAAQIAEGTKLFVQL